MEAQILQKLVEYGGATAVIVALTIFVIYLKKNNNHPKREDLEILKQELENNHLHTLNQRIDNFYQEFSKFKEEILQRIVALEERIKIQRKR